MKNKFPPPGWGVFVVVGTLMLLCKASGMRVLRQCNYYEPVTKPLVTRDSLTHCQESSETFYIYLRFWIVCRLRLMVCWRACAVAGRFKRTHPANECAMCFCMSLFQQQEKNIIQLRSALPNREIYVPVHISLIAMCVRSTARLSSPAGGCVGSHVCCACCCSVIKITRCTVNAFCTLAERTHTQIHASTHTRRSHRFEHRARTAAL